MGNFERKTKLKRGDLLRFTETNPWNIPPFFLLNQREKEAILNKKSST